MPFQNWLLNLRLGLKSLALHRMRSLLTVLGVVLGVGSVIVMVSIGEGARHEALAQIQELGATNIILRSVQPAGLKSDSESMAIRYGLTEQDLKQIETIPTVVSVSPVRERLRKVRHMDHEVECRVLGVTPGFAEGQGIRMRAGRFITQRDVSEVATVAVLTAPTAEQLFPFQDPIGRSVRIGEDHYFVVVGVTEPRGARSGSGAGLPSQDSQRDVYLPFTSEIARLGQMFTFTSGGMLLGEIVEFSQITVAMSDTKQVKETAEIIRSVLAEGHKLPDTVVIVPLELLERAEKTQRVFTMVLGAIASISLLVGGIGIMNIMLATVTERTREIGIRRALGAKRRDIIRQFLMETMVLSGIGGVLGICLGVSLSFLVGRFVDMPTLIRFWSLALALTISIGVGLVFGTYPARQAACLDPIEALRHE